MQKNLPQKWHNVTHKTSKQSKRHSKASSRWLRALCLDRSAYSLPTVVEVAAVAGVALHAQVTGRPRWCRMTWHLGGHKLFDSLFTLCWLLAPNCNYTTYRRGSNTHTHTLKMNLSYFCEQRVKRVSYIALRCSLTEVIVTATSIQRLEVLRCNTTTFITHWRKSYLIYAAWLMNHHQLIDEANFGCSCHD